MAFDLLAQGSDPRSGSAWTVKTFTAGNTENGSGGRGSPWLLDLVEAEI